MVDRATSLIQKWLKEPPPKRFDASRLSKWCLSIRFPDGKKNSMAMTQTELGDRLNGLSVRSISLFEKGETRPGEKRKGISDKALEAIALYTNCTIEQTAHWLGVRLEKVDSNGVYARLEALERENKALRSEMMEMRKVLLEMKEDRAIARELGSFATQ